MDPGRKPTPASEHVSRYLIGIDLGTTNSVVAYIDTQEAEDAESPRIHVFEVSQLVGPGEVRRLPYLPSFLYFPTEAEMASGTLALPWEERPTSIAGVMAREQGALQPGRQASSAKSWLCQSDVDRTADILPVDAEPSATKISPIDASARYLIHLRDAWNWAMAGHEAGNEEHRLENQQIVLTVPASFDEEARELTVEAAHRAGLEKLILLEEPLAAFYAWIAQHQPTMHEHVRDGDLILVCDIGGGTSDFSLVRARSRGQAVQFERTAIGNHLLLGGENLDVALARRVEQKLQAKLSLRQRRALQIACSAAKERLLTEPDVDHLSINILGGGRAVVGQMVSSELTRDEVVELLNDGFLPLSPLRELPARARSSGLRELGLRYETDPAISRHLATFLSQAAQAMGHAAPSPSSGNERDVAIPDAVLFNGGFCVPEIARERIAKVLSLLAGKQDQHWRPKILANTSMNSAVALGAAYYARVRRGTGLSVKAGSARSYYIGMRSNNGGKAVCVLPAGTGEGTTLSLSGREFAVLANRPVSFDLYSSTIRHDAHGDLSDLDSGQMHRHAPLVTLLRYGKKLQELDLAVRVAVSFTEVGTLELWCESLKTPHRWRLQFELRGHDNQPQGAETEPTRGAKAERSPSSQVSEEALQSAAQLIKATFTKVPDGAAGDPTLLVSELEGIIGFRKESWPLSLARLLADTLLEVAEGRSLSARHEVRWLNLLGYCLRPGFGDPLDSHRLAKTRKIYQGGLKFPANLQSQVDWLVLWRRIAGGLSAAHQHELRNYLAGLGIGRKKTGPRLNPQLERDGWRLLASLEHLSGATRAALGNELQRKLKKEPADGSWLWSLGRFGARIPLYSALTCVVPVDTAAEWITTLVELPKQTHETASAILQLARLTGDRTRDVSGEIRELAIARLREAEPTVESIVQPISAPVSPNRDDVARTFGEPLPRGLHLESTANCLSPVSALGTEAQAG